MSISSSSDWSKISDDVSYKSRRSGKSLADRIRELGIKLRNRDEISWESLQLVETKTESFRASNVLVMVPRLNLEQITYYQPELMTNYEGKNLYKIEKFETTSPGPKEIRKITDIEVKSVKPLKRMKFRKKKRHSSMMRRVIKILNRGRPVISRDPSEESVYFEEIIEPPKEINDLPESILQRIFSLLTRQERCLTVARVCKYWYFVLKDPIFWSSFEFTGTKIPTATIILLLKKYPTVERLKLTAVPNVVEILQELCRCNMTIKNLAVRYCDTKSQDFARTILHVISCCTNLEVLDIKGMKFQSERFYLELGRLKKLRSLNLTGNKCTNVTDLITIAVNCRELQELKILDTLDKDSDNVLKDDDLLFIISHLYKNLKTLKIDMQQLRNPSYQAIMKCKDLRHLVLKNCLLLTSSTFRHFGDFQNLKKLKITRAINIKPEDFQWVFEGETMQNIEELDLNGCCGVGEIALQTITRNLHSLKSLSLKNCKSVAGPHLVYLSRCPKLSALNVAHTKVRAKDLLSINSYLINLKRLITDSKIPRKTLRKLSNLHPEMSIRLSFSEFQKDERPLSPKQNFEESES